MANLVKTAMLLAVMTALFMAVGYFIGGQGGMMIAFVMAAATNVFAWWNSGSMVLKMHGAREVDEQSAPELVMMVRDLAERAQLPMPKVYVLETEQPNAFATGRNPENAAVAASAGLLNMMTSQEVAAVMAHELAHIKNRDTLTMTITATLAGAIGMLSNFAFFFSGNRNNPLGIVGVLIAVIVAPMAAGIVQMAISRAREYEADKDGAEICGNPLWLAMALEKIAAAAGRVVNRQAENAPATAHLFIINPLNGQAFDSLFSTHPSTQNRIQALEALHREWQLADEASTRRIQPNQPQRRTEEREIFGRNAGQLRERPSMEPERRSGPWGEAQSAEDRNSRSRRKGPWG